MAYRTKILVGDAYEVSDIVVNDLEPYIANVKLEENTGSGDKLTLGSAVSSRVTFDLYESPLETLDGVKVQLFVRDVDDIALDQSEEEFPETELELNIDDNTTMEDLTDEPDVSEEVDPEATDGEVDAFAAEFDLDDVEDIDTDAEAVDREMSDTVVADETEEVPEENTNYREEDSVDSLTTITDTVYDETDEWTSMGVFYVSSTTDRGEYISVTALDGFVLMNDDYSPLSGAHTLAEHYAEFTSQCEAIGIEVNDESLANISFTWTVPCTLREAAGYFASFMGGFATFSREGVLDLKQYLKTEVELQPIDVTGFNKTVSGGTRIDSIACQVTNTGVYIRYPAESGHSATTVVCSNPMITEAMLPDILEIYNNLIYQPCEATVNWHPAIEAGDVIQVTTDEDAYWICVTNQTIEFVSGASAISSLGGGETAADFVSPTVKNIIEAGKTATNYITEAEDGSLVIRRDTDDYNVRIDADSLDVRNGEDVVASFGSNEVSLAKNNGNTGSVNFCGDRFAIEMINRDVMEISPKQNALEIGDIFPIVGVDDSNLPSVSMQLQEKVGAGAYQSLAMFRIKQRNGETTISLDADAIDISGNTISDGDIKAPSFTFMGHSSPIGSITADVLSATKTINTTWRPFCSISLPAGTWIVIGQVSSNDTVSSACTMKANIATTSASTYVQITNYSASGQQNRFQLHSIQNLSATTTVYLNAYSSVSTTLGTNTYIRAIRIV